MSARAAAVIGAWGSVAVTVICACVAALLISEDAAAGFLLFGVIHVGAAFFATLVATT